MKNRILFFLTMLSLAATAIACNKSKEQEQDLPPITKYERYVKSVSSIDPYYKREQIYNFYYLSDGRLQRNVIDYTRYNNTERQVAMYSYYDNIIEISFSEGGVVGELDGNGFIANTSTSSERNTTSYRYDNGYLVSIVEGNNNYTYGWSDGNMVSTSMSFSSGSTYSTYSYSSMLNNTGCNLDLNTLVGDIDEAMAEASIFSALGYCGKRSKNLISKFVMNTSGDTTSKTYDISYTFDSDGYITKIVITTTSSSRVITHYITYY